MDFPIEAFRKVIDELCEARENGSLTDFIFGDNKRIASWETEVEVETQNAIRCSHGISKLVFLSDSFGEWVIKVPRHLGRIQDFCKLEVKNYAEATDRYLDEFFAPTFFVETYHKIPIYAQLRLECERVNRANIEECFYSYARTLCDPDDWEEDEYEDIVYSTADNFDAPEQLTAIFGNNRKIGELLEFCEEFGINDLHEGNFGEYDGEFLICDFSGF